jgi:hypothetical protein
VPHLSCSHNRSSTLVRASRTFHRAQRFSSYTSVTSHGCASIPSIPQLHRRDMCFKIYYIWFPLEGPRVQLCVPLPPLPPLIDLYTLSCTSFGFSLNKPSSSHIHFAISTRSTGVLISLSVASLSAPFFKSKLKRSGLKRLEQ